MPNPRKRPGDYSQSAKLVVDIATGEVEDRPPTPEKRVEHPAHLLCARGNGYFLLLRKSRFSSKRRRFAARHRSASRAVRQEGAAWPAHQLRQFGEYWPRSASPFSLQCKSYPLVAPVRAQL